MKNLLLLLGIMITSPLIIASDKKMHHSHPIANDNVTNFDSNADTIKVEQSDFDFEMGCQLKEDSFNKFYKAIFTIDQKIKPQMVKFFFNNIARVSNQLGRDFQRDQQLNVQPEIKRLTAERDALKLQVEQNQNYIEEAKEKILELNENLNICKKQLTQLPVVSTNNNENLTEENKKLKLELAKLQTNNDLLISSNIVKLSKILLVLFSLYFIISGNCFGYFSLPPLIAKALGK